MLFPPATQLKKICRHILPPISFIAFSGSVLLFNYRKAFVEGANLHEKA